MEKLISFDAAAYKTKIEYEILKGNVEETQKLIDQYCEFQGFNEVIKLPDNFIDNLIQSERRKKMMRRKQLFKTVVAAVIVLCFMGGSAYAATNYFTKVKHIDHGLATEKAAVKSGQSNDTNLAAEEAAVKSSQSNDVNFTAEDTAQIREAMSILGDSWKVIEKVSGNDNTKWIQKITREDVSPSYISDDGINWTRSEDKGTLAVEYLYDIYSYALADSILPNVLSDKIIEDLSLVNGISYLEYHAEQQEDITGKELSADFKYGNSGIVHFDLKSDLKLKDGEETESVVITGIGKATNQRYYTTKSGVEYALSDNTNDGITNTTTFITSGRYLLILQFTDITDDQIHEILEAIDTSALLQKQ